MKKMLKKPNSKVLSGNLVVAYVNSLIVGRHTTINNDTDCVITIS